MGFTKELNMQSLGQWYVYYQYGNGDGAVGGEDGEVRLCEP